MARRIRKSQIRRREDGVAFGLWGGYELHSAFQPIFAFAPEGLHRVACEALLRPYREGHPLVVIDFLGSVAPSDRFEVESLARAIHLLNAGAFLGPQTSVFLNFDPSLLGDADTMRTALSGMRLVLREAGLVPSGVVCEVTEQNAGSQSDLSRFADALRDQGFAIAVDDFGAAWSDMARVSTLRPDIVKFDARWVARHLGSKYTFEAAAETVARFREQGYRTVFEGIEHAWQIERAEACGATMVQGYALGRPELVTTLTATGRPDAASDSPSEAAPARFPHDDCGCLAQ